MCDRLANVLTISLKAYHYQDKMLFTMVSDVVAYISTLDPSSKTLDLFFFEFGFEFANQSWRSRLEMSLPPQLTIRLWEKVHLNLQSSAQSVGDTLLL